MTEQHDTDRWREIRTIHREYGNFYWGMGLAILFVLGVWIGRNLFPNKGQDFDLNIVTELLGGLVVGSAFAFLENRRSEQRHKLQLVEDVASSSNDVAKHAIHQIRRRGWLKGATGILQDQDLQGANLSDANLREANLQKADLSNAKLANAVLVGANLREATLSSTYLEKANLVQANLQNTTMSGAILNGAWLVNAKLQHANLELAEMKHAAMEASKLQSAKLEGANLEDSNLERADLSNANLEAANLSSSRLEQANLKNASLKGANLRGANLTNANLEGVKLSVHPKCDPFTILPDRTNWTPSVDWEYFINPAHKDFWRSTNSESPAFDEKYRNLVISIED